jgi:hypothetical protein
MREEMAGAAERLSCVCVRGGGELVTGREVRSPWWKGDVLLWDISSKIRGV